MLQTTTSAPTAPLLVVVQSTRSGERSAEIKDRTSETRENKVLAWAEKPWNHRGGKWKEADGRHLKQILSLSVCIYGKMRDINFKFKWLIVQRKPSTSTTALLDDVLSFSFTHSTALWKPWHHVYFLVISNLVASLHGRRACKCAHGFRWPRPSNSTPSAPRAIVCAHKVYR